MLKKVFSCFVFDNCLWWCFLILFLDSFAVVTNKNQRKGHRRSRFVWLGLQRFMRIILTATNRSDMGNINIMNLAQRVQEEEEKERQEKEREKEMEAERKKQEELEEEQQKEREERREERRRKRRKEKEKEKDAKEETREEKEETKEETKEEGEKEDEAKKKPAEIDGASSDPPARKKRRKKKERNPVETKRNEDANSDQSAPSQTPPGDRRSKRLMALFDD